MAISAVGVVVPAHDEEALLPDCLRALEVAMRRAAVPAMAVVVLDDCHDRSAAVVAGRRHVRTLALQARNVGRARAAGFEMLLGWGCATPPDQFWLATTDADSTVPENWLEVQLRHADQGFEVVLGTVKVADWSDRSEVVVERFLARYDTRDDHDQVHGANLGMTAAAYLAAGGVPPLELAEDRALALSLSQRRVLRTARIPVTTSSRISARVRGGFAGYLDSLAT
jgi:glycosyltransferase involved in cell wall biosynthesis